MEQTNTKENIMGTMPEGKLLLKLAMPMIFSVLVSSLYNIVDSIFVGSSAIMVVGTILYETIPALLLRIFSATDEMLAIGIPAFRIIGITAIISGMTIMMSGVFQAMNNSGKALAVSIVQAVTLVGSAAVLALTHSTSMVWFSFPISEIVIFVLSLVFLRGIYREYLEDGRAPAKEMLNAGSVADIM